MAVRAGHESCMTAGHIDDVVDTHYGSSYCEEVGQLCISKKVWKSFYLSTKSGA
jgi:hypothetical protein